MARHRCDISSKGAVLPGRNDAEMGPPTCYTLRRITASIMKDLIDLNIEKVLKKSADSLQTRCSLLACVL